MVVIGLGKNLLFKSVLAHCVHEVELCFEKAITEMVPDLIWAPDFLLFWALRNFGPKKLGPHEILALHEHHFTAF